MEVRSFYCCDLREDSMEVKLCGEELHHLSKVLRLSEGARVRIFNGEGVGAEGVVERIDRDSALITVERTRREACGESQIETILITALLKGDRTDFVIRKATELGATEIFLFSSEHAVAELKEEKAGERLKRWQRIIVEAAKQCGRTRLPKLAYFASLREAVEDTRGGFKVILFEKEGGRGLKECMEGYAGEPRVKMLIGPEGGFTEDEVGAAERAGFVSARMGGRRLRAETAAVAALSIVQYECGDLGLAASPGKPEEGAG